MIFDHLGVVVPHLTVGRSMLSEAIGIRRWTAEFEDPMNDVFVQFGLCPSGMCYETIAPRSPQSPVRSALKKRVNILNHVAYRVTNLADEAGRLQGQGFRPVGEPKPAIAYDGHLIQFFMNPAYFFIEMIEAPEHRHQYVDQG
jgi:methylmalonyl-CoA/ethylmalonyl-CoA epimerase